MSRSASDGPAHGVGELEVVAPGIIRVRAENPGPMTLEGTNTWIVHGSGAASAVVIDPGPALASHAAALRGVLADHGLEVEVVLLTHGHADHSDLARDFAAGVRAPLRAVDPAWSTASPIADAEAIDAGGVQLRALATPGHTSDSVTFEMPGYLLTGDTVLGRGTTVVAHPDGRLGDYLASLTLLRERTATGEIDALLPGHGPVIHDPLPRLDAYLAHRRERLSAVALVVDAAGVHTADLSDSELDDLVGEIVAQVYADVPKHLWPAASLSVRAQVLYLAETR